MFQKKLQPTLHYDDYSCNLCGAHDDATVLAPTSGVQSLLQKGPLCPIMTQWAGVILTMVTAVDMETAVPGFYA